MTGSKTRDDRPPVRAGGIFALLPAIAADSCLNPPECFLCSALVLWYRSLVKPTTLLPRNLYWPARAELGSCPWSCCFAGTGLLASDTATRIRASHVCRTWREVALAERRLWNTFSCSHFSNAQHERAMFSLLQVLLLRSRPLPFHLKIPELHRATRADGIPFLALHSVTIACMHGLHHRALFSHCPRLVRLDISDSPMGTPLPDPPVPTTLEEVSIRCVRPTALEFVALVRHWRGVRVPRFVARDLYSLQGVLPLFLASHAQAIQVRLPGCADDVVLSAGTNDRRVWTLSPSPLWAADFLASLEKPTSRRLTSITVAFSRLGELLRAQLHAPGLRHIELCLDIADADTLRQLTGDESSLRAPQLRSVRFTSGKHCVNPVEDALSVLHSSCRSILIYDAELLDTITVSRLAERVCASFASLAKDYVVSGRS